MMSRNQSLLSKPGTLTLSIILCLIITGSLGQYDNSETCKIYKKCGLCLQNSGCAWCQDPRFSRDNSTIYDRCNTREGHAGSCSDSYLLEQEEPLATEKQGSPQKGKAIQTGDYDVILARGQKINITVTYVDQGNKPLDLYYLMDLSATMAPSKDAVSQLGRDFAVALKETTTDLQMGFGSFVDKPMMPYSTYAQLRQPWDAKSRPPYGYENHLPLTVVKRDDNLFENTVRGARISLNLDAPEGGLDAMMQVMECWDEIGWRERAHRILVVSTDGSFHIAGDGKLGGLVIPNDGKCHMANNSYTGSTEYDYPSISQITAKIREKKIYVVFAVLETVWELYNTLASLVQEYASTIRIDSKSSVVATLVKEQYNKTRSRIRLSASPKEGVELTYYAKCGPNAQYVQSDKCENLQPHAEITFKVQIEVRSCPSNPADWNPQIIIAPDASQEGLRVNLEMRCGCDCEERDDRDNSNSDCSRGQGALRCGICSCKTGFKGEYCQCEAGAAVSVDKRKCKARDSDRELCGGKGECDCGQCDCRSPFSGTYCECDKRKCSCADSKTGKCYCEECRCDEGYAGENCACSTSKDACTKAGMICENKGECKCNECKCNKGHTGKYCDICQNCKCLEGFFLCATERLNKTHINATEGHVSKCLNGSHTNIKITELSPNISVQNEAEQLCSTTIDGCSVEYIFGYKEHDQSIHVRVRNTLDCPLPPRPTNPLPIILVTIGSVLFFGILTLLLWKIITYCLDKHEFKKFEKEARSGQWGVGQSPLYIEATSTFQNPAYTD